MKLKLKKIANKAAKIIGSRYFFWFIIALFIFQAVWIALSFRYSMIYDEYYHFGLIEYFSHQWLPWISNQPVSLDQYGALARSPYLLYHYLMSFPFRVVSLFTNDFYTQVVAMRFVNIGLFACSLVIFMRLFRAMKIQPVFRNIALLFFVLLPATPFVAATVNYDNATLPLTALFVFIGLKIIKSEKTQWHNYALLILIGMAGSLMKISFLPIFAAGFAYVFIRLLIKQKTKIVHDLVQSFSRSRIWLKVAILIPFVVVGFIFMERFAVNIVKYHSLSPSCESLMSKNRCRSNYIELRSYDLKKSRTGNPVQFPQYASTWVYSMEFGLVVTGANTNGKVGTKMGAPLPIIYTVVFIGAIVSVVAIAYGFEKLKNISGFWLIASVIALYFSALFYTNTSLYYEYYQLLAIQGRYLLPILPFIFIFALLGINYAMRSNTLLKAIFFTVVFALYLNGAGVITHIMRSDCSWYWDNQTVCKVNNEARNLLTPFIKEYWYER